MSRMRSNNMWMQYNDSNYAEKIAVQLREKSYTVQVQDFLSGFWMTKVTVINVRGHSKQSEVAKILSPNIHGGHAYYER